MSSSNTSQSNFYRFIHNYSIILLAKQNSKLKQVVTVDSTLPNIRTMKRKKSNIMGESGVVDVAATVQQLRSMIKTSQPTTAGFVCPMSKPSVI
jgi:hypothetical protein